MESGGSTVVRRRHPRCYNPGPEPRRTTMTLSMYQASVPVFIRMLTNLKAVLQKAAAHAQARKIDEAVLVNARLYPDMLPLSRQVQIASDMARGGAARLGAPNRRRTKTTKRPSPSSSPDRSHDRIFAHQEGWTRSTARKAAKSCAPSAANRTSSAESITCCSMPAQLFFPRDDRLRDPAPQRDRSRQEGLHRQDGLTGPKRRARRKHAAG